ncbi:hypothetical protein [Brucella anthropi]|uniref:hypothetical protein n=1 Tax=Brucella anthropi TaxID=529 RepID=UPI0005BCFDDF|nr:hypothetical protein [Brucella anthropi]KIU69109.1 hypothetical protein TR92_07480 [Brucella anthropi]
MKIALTKDMARERQAAREQLDQLFAARIEAALGPKATLYAVKYAAALAVLNGDGSPLIAGAAEAETVIRKNHDMQAALASVESERQTLQAEIDRAKTAREIETILERIANEVTL